MTIAAVQIPSGVAHFQALGPITIGVLAGQVPALGLNQLLTLPLAIKKEIYRLPGFEDQFYMLAKALDGNTTDIRIDAMPFTYDPTTGAPILRLRIDISAVPAQVDILLEAHHSTGR